MALSPELVARVRRVVANPGPDSDFETYSDEDYDTIAQTILASHAPSQDAWFFAYGSLIWNPVAGHVEQRIGIARGWHRSFGLRLTLWRGTKDQPGLMMVLDRGGQCQGILYRLAAETLEAQLGKLLRREMPLKPAQKQPTNVPRWITVETAQGPIRAITFVANPKGANYVGRLPLEQVVDMLAKACGHGGSCAEYLYNTVLHLEEHGIRDHYLWRLQALVADRIAALPTLSGGSDVMSG